MPAAKCRRCWWTLTPFLYPSPLLRPSRFTNGLVEFQGYREEHTTSTTPAVSAAPELHLPSSPRPHSRLNPSPSDYSLTPFTDRCTLTVQAGAGGHGCISFQREKFISAGPANGGDGGSGGNIYIQAVANNTSLHYLSRQGVLRAGRGSNGQGKSRGGERGEDVLLEVPVGTVVRETSRWDPIAEEEQEEFARRAQEQTVGAEVEGVAGQDQPGRWHRDKWLLYPASKPSDYISVSFPQVQRSRRSPLAAIQPAAPINLDLSSPMDKPILLAAGTAGGLGNPHFVTRSLSRPKFATKGGPGLRLTLDLELKILADVGLVGLPNAGKSTLLRALTRSRARVGSWAFTTLQPNIGTVVLDDHSGRPRFQAKIRQARTRFTIADIPGLIENAHLDRGLGLGFLRHVERAKILALVVDLSREDAVQAVERLWREMREYDALRHGDAPDISDISQEEHEVTWTPLAGSSDGNSSFNGIRPPPRISSKPWFVVATKADLPETQHNFTALQAYLDSLPASTSSKQDQPGLGSLRVGTGTERGRRGWNGRVRAIPVSAINGEGVDRIVEHTLELFLGWGLKDRDERK